MCRRRQDTTAGGVLGARRKLAASFATALAAAAPAASTSVAATIALAATIAFLLRTLATASCFCTHLRANTILAISALTFAVLVTLATSALASATLTPGAWRAATSTHAFPAAAATLLAARC